MRCRGDARASSVVFATEKRVEVWHLALAVAEIAAPRHGAGCKRHTRHGKDFTFRAWTWTFFPCMRRPIGCSRGGRVSCRETAAASTSPDASRICGRMNGACSSGRSPQGVGRGGRCAWSRKAGPVRSTSTADAPRTPRVRSVAARSSARARSVRSGGRRAPRWRRSEGASPRRRRPRTRAATDRARSRVCSVGESLPSKAARVSSS